MAKVVNYIPLEEVAKITVIVTKDLTEYQKATDDGFTVTTKEKFLMYRGSPEYQDTFKDVVVTHSVEDMKQMVIKVWGNPTNDFSHTVHDTMFYEDGGLRNAINEKLIGIAIYGFFGANKEILRQEEQNVVGGNKSEFVGVVGTKISMELTYKKTFWFEDYGINLFEDESGNVFKWATAKSVKVEAGCEEGDKIMVTGTIKAHNEYKGIKQTVITRCKVSK